MRGQDGGIGRLSTRGHKGTVGAEGKWSMSLLGIVYTDTYMCQTSSHSTL